MSRPSKLDTLIGRWAAPIFGEHTRWAEAITRYLKRGDGDLLAEQLKSGDPPPLAREFLAEVAAGRVKPQRAGRPRKHGLPKMWHAWAAVQAARELGASKSDAEHCAALLYDLDGEDTARGIADDMHEAGMLWGDVPEHVRERYRAVVRAAGARQGRLPPAA